MLSLIHIYIVEKAEEGVAITVLFDEDTTKEEKEDIGEKLEAADGVLKINYVSAEEAWESFQDEYFKGSEEAAEGLDVYKRQGIDREYRI